MGNKPDLRDVLKILEMKDEVSRLYDEIDETVLAMKKEYGAGRFDYQLEDGGEAPFLKFEIVDNIQQLLEKGSAFKTVGFKPISFSIGHLKRIPASLK